MQSLGCREHEFVERPRRGNERASKITSEKKKLEGMRDRNDENDVQNNLESRLIFFFFFFFDKHGWSCPREDNLVTRVASVGEQTEIEIAAVKTKARDMSFQLRVL